MLEDGFQWHIFLTWHVKSDAIRDLINGELETRHYEEKITLREYLDNLEAVRNDNALNWNVGLVQPQQPFKPSDRSVMFHGLKNIKR